MANNYSKMYFKNLDAPRFLAFLVVFVEHIIFTQDKAIRGSSLFKFYDDHLSIGVIGWDFYTVLSGFLITWIILEEYQFTSKFSLAYFWLKRCLRIWPLYFLMILAGLSLVWVSRDILGNTVSDIPPLSWLFTFTLNFYIVKHGYNFLYFLVFFWSISVEEQCYAAWGILLKWVKKTFVPFCVLLVIMSLLFRIFALHDSLNLHFNSLSWVGNFASGGLLAYFCINRKGAFERLKKIPLRVIASVYALFILNLAFYKQIYASEVMTVVERLSATLFFGFMIFEQTFCQKHLFQLGKIPFLNYLGRISYGLFCYHGLVILFYEHFTQHVQGINSPIAVFVINPIVIFALTILISALSYTYFERPIMALRHQYKTA
jgi:peptidoglycan/LPS O-acetylase OafA/YrhL